MTALPPLMGTEDWAVLLQCSQKTVEERLRLGDLPGEKFGDGWICPTEAMLARINEIAVEKMVARRTAAWIAPAPRLVAVGGKRQLPPALE